MLRAGQITIAAALLALIAAPTLAAPITTPVGLNPGDTYRLAFLPNLATTAQHRRL